MTNAWVYFGAETRAEALSNRFSSVRSARTCFAAWGFLCGMVFLTSSLQAQEKSKADAPSTSKDSQKSEAGDSLSDSSLTDSPAKKKKPKKDAKQSLLVLVPTGDEVPENSRRTVASLVSVECQNLGYEVITADDVKKMIELEAEKQAVGCVDESCVAELAGALGAELVVFGDVGKLGSVMIFTFNLYNSDEARSTGRVSLKVRSLEEIPDVLPAAMAKLVNRTKVASAKVPDASAEKEPTSSTTIEKTSGKKEGGSSLAWVWWSVTGIGAATALGGLAIDQVSPSSFDGQLNEADFIIAGVIGAGVLMAGTGLTLVLLDVGGE